MGELNYLAIDCIEYEEALKIQKELVKKRYEKQVEDTLILLEHPHVYTIGRKGSEENLLISQEELLKQKIHFIRTDRGGDITYHGPGQLVGYIIFDLRTYRKDIKLFFFKVEEMFLKLLKNEFHIEARRDKEHPGIWVEDKKLIALGFCIEKWITYHGFAFNINTAMEYFNQINPCGIKDKGVVSLENILGRQMDMSVMKNLVLKYFKEEFGFTDYKEMGSI